ncbi:protein phosphatase, partial [Streptomyces sp. SID8361]
GLPQGSYGDYAEGDFTKKSGRKTWAKRSLFIVLGLAVIGGGLYGGYRWTQTQYYVGSNGDHVAIYQGISQDLAWIKLNKVHEDHREIELKYLPPDQRGRVEDTITVSGLGQARDKTKDLATLAGACKKADAQDKAEDSQKDLTGGDKGKGDGASGGSASSSADPSHSSSGQPGNEKTESQLGARAAKATNKPTPTTSPTPKPGPTLSEEEKKLVPQCSSTQ